MISGMLEICDSFSAVLCELEASKLTNVTQVVNGLSEKLALLQLEGDPRLIQ